MKIPIIFTLYLVILITSVSSCKKEELGIDVPQCVEKQIKELKSKAVSNPPAQVWKWEADGATYFYITSDCCDQFNYLYDENGNVVCAPDGGMTGQGDGKCPEFDENIQKTLVWEDKRS